MLKANFRNPFFRRIIIETPPQPKHKSLLLKKYSRLSVVSPSQALPRYKLGEE
jgi:hypothetical protein